MRQSPESTIGIHLRPKNRYLQRKISARRPIPKFLDYKKCLQSGDRERFNPLAIGALRNSGVTMPAVVVLFPNLPAFLTEIKPEVIGLCNGCVTAIDASTYFRQNHSIVEFSKTFKLGGNTVFP